MSKQINLAFSGELIEDVLNGTKTATVRYRGPRAKRGDILVAETTEGKPFAEKKITRTASVIAVEAHSFIEMVGAKHGSDSPEDLIDIINGFYEETIRPGTTLEVYVFGDF